jgi:hypothetical protein
LCGIFLRGHQPGRLIRFLEHRIGDKVPTPDLLRRRAQELSRPAGTLPVRHPAAFPGRALTAPSTAAPSVGRGGAKQAASAPRSSTQLHNLVKSRKSKTASPISVYSKLEGGTKAAFSAATLSCSDHKSRSYSMISTMRRLRGSTMTGRSFTIAYR